MTDELSNLLDTRIREYNAKDRAEYESRRPADYQPKINASDFGMCRRSIKFRLLNYARREPTLDELNRFEKGHEAARWVKKYLLPAEILGEETPVETRAIRGKCDLILSIGGKNILYETKSKDRMYIKFLKTSDDT